MMPPTNKYHLLGIGLLSQAILSQSASNNGLGPSAYTISGVFPTSLYSSYYNDPTATSVEPQPVISDPITHEIYPYWLTNPETIPQTDTWETHLLPPVASSSRIVDTAFNEIVAIANSSLFGDDTCAQCMSSLAIAKLVTLAAPEEGPNLFVRLCEYFDLSTTCDALYNIYTLGSFVTQVISYADVTGLDGETICANFFDACSIPPTSPLDLTNWFAKPKPNPLPPPRQPSGERLKILHLSDLHIDPRYMIGSEANCSQNPCCRAQSYHEGSNVTVEPAPRYGAFVCDSPYPLIVGALQSVPILTGTENTGFDFTIYTGDLVSHDPLNELSREYTVYTETVLFDLVKRLTNPGPIYAVQGNHDTYMSGQNAAYNIGGNLSTQFDWNYDQLAALWELDGELPEYAAQQARKNYAAYAVQRRDGLRIIALNTDFWYTQNTFNYINLSLSDNSGMLRWLTDELQDAEDADERVWILGHVPSGWDASDPLANPTNLFYQIVDRYSPHVIAGIFFGHTHMDMLTIYYANNATVMNTDTAQTVAWIGPSVVPITNYNSGYRMYEVDSGTFEVLDAYTWWSNVSTWPALDGQTEFGPTFELEYNTRETYGATINWGPDDPLNATWWHLVTEAMEANSTLVELFNDYQTKKSDRGSPCTGSCIPTKICSIRSGSASLILERCPDAEG